MTHLISDIPGALYTLSTFYKKTELGSRTSLFFLGNMLVSGVGGLLAAGILQIRGWLHPWQYLFLIEGLMAIFCALLFLILLPDSPERPVPLFFSGLTLFTEREKEIIRARVVLDDVNKAKGRRPLTRKEIVDTLLHWRNYPHLLHAIACIGATSAMGQYGPLLIKGFGFSTVRANALSSVGGWIGLTVMITTGFISDRMKNKGYLVIALSVCSLTCWIACKYIPNIEHCSSNIPVQAKSSSADKWAKYATLVCTTGFAMSWHPINATWLSLNQKTPQQRAIAMAMFVMAANLGALIGSQILRARDSPKYPVGFRVCVSLIAFGTAVSIFQHFQYRFSNERNEKKLANGEALREDRPEVYVM